MRIIKTELHKVKVGDSVRLRNTRGKLFVSQVEKVDLLDRSITVKHSIYNYYPKRKVSVVIELEAQELGENK